MAIVIISVIVMAKILKRLRENAEINSVPGGSSQCTGIDKNKGVRSMENNLFNIFFTKY